MLLPALLFLPDEFHNIGHFTLKKNTQLVNGIGGDTFSIFHSVVGASGKAHFFQTVGGNVFLFQRFEKRLITDQFPHLPKDTVSIIANLGLAYVKIFVHNIGEGSDSTWKNDYMQKRKKKY